MYLPRSSRSARALLWALVTLLVLFLGLLIYQKFLANLRRYTVNPDLLAELRDAEFIDKAPSPKLSWPQWLGPQRDGVTHEPNLLLEWPEKGPKVLWELRGEDESGNPLRGGFSSFAVRGDHVYTMFGEGEEEIVICLEADTGKKVWSDTLPIQGAPQYPGPRSTPTLAEDRLYVVSSVGLFRCYEASQGKMLWEHDLKTEFATKQPSWGFACSPLIVDDLVIVVPGGSSGNSVVAFDRETGKPRWQAGSDPAGYSSPVSFEVGGVKQVVVFTAQNVIGLKANDGEELWRYPWETDYGVNAATPITFHTKRGETVSSYVFISSGYRTGCALVKVAGSGEAGFQAQAVYVSNVLACHFSTPVRYQDHLYGMNEDRPLLTCLDLRTGKVKWQKQGFHKGTLIRVDDHLLVMGERGNLALVKANPEKYQEISQARVLRSQRCWSTPTLADGKLYVRDQDHVVCLEMRKQE
jgi:outer membrane protein assembly factor BamB